MGTHPESIPLEQVAQGQTYRFSRLFSAEDLQAMVALSGDRAGYHVDEAFAKKAGFAELITPGILQASMTAKLGSDLNLLLVEVGFKYQKPVVAGDTLTCQATVEKVDRRMVELSFVITNQEDVVVLEGFSKGLAPKPEWGTPQKPPLAFESLP